MYSLARPFFFLLDPEAAHDLTIWGMHHFGGFIPTVCGARGKPVEVMGLSFPNRIGLAAGLDKNGEAIDAFANFGFGHIEIGTVTPRPQPGNPKPRLFRLPRAEAIINRMGFNNAGVDNLVANVRAAKFKGILGINIGKNFDTPIERAADDYLACLDKVYPHASYVTVNISSPNTKNLRQLQGASELDALLAALKARQAMLADEHGRYVPLALKIAPDVEDEQLGEMADALRRHRIDGVIATNTTLARDTVASLPHAQETGGLSGAPLRQRSTEVVAKLARLLAGELPIIAVGGVSSGEHALEKLQAGAELVQIYTGLIYRGPSVISEAIRATDNFERG
ncbi:quinone-dependent dihydroorotate dehydrogenase [Niveibacterium umoris]|uniref:Dihydroorotate dehydrogenase (quinone) n=1 Tax=Niveibacterium umoris TaxID=1193620 RepID=A0A840BK17_9RHOO|nr:quinone-dependent dihydroorotate dehydrogenase [Niveibacterium umoris]MBB4011928.1 dihydroorotate dehydrogenase [Niveibacterium umoris]